MTEDGYMVSTAGHIEVFPPQSMQTRGEQLQIRAERCPAYVDGHLHDAGGHLPMRGSGCACIRTRLRLRWDGRAPSGS